MEKEACPFGVRLQEYSYWVNGGRYPAALFTDHKNLIALFNDKARPLSCTKPNRPRLTRWGINLLSMKYIIYHIDGTENRLTDLGSRWALPIISFPKVVDVRVHAVNNLQFV